MQFDENQGQVGLRPDSSSKVVSLGLRGSTGTTEAEGPDSRVADANGDGIGIGSSSETDTALCLFRVLLFLGEGERDEELEDLEEEDAHANELRDENGCGVIRTKPSIIMAKTCCV